MTDVDASTMILLSIREDGGPFVHLGTRFRCNGARWLGTAVVSPIAIYLLKKGKNTHSYGGGIAGALLATAFAKEDGLSTCTAADLPDAVRAVMDPKGKKATKDVVIIPRATVSLVKGGGFRNRITILAGADKFTVATNFFMMFAKPRAMRSMGWTLNAPVTPTAAPVHDTRSELERAEPAGKPLWFKILMVIVAVAIVGGYILLRTLVG